MKTSNKILIVYGTLFAAFTFGSLGLNVSKYRASRGDVEQCLEALAAGRELPVLVVEEGTVVAFHRSGYGMFMAHSRGAGIVQAWVSGDSLFVSGARYLANPNSVRRIVRGDETIDVPPAAEWKDGEKFF